MRNKLIAVRMYDKELRKLDIIVRRRQRASGRKADRSSVMRALIEEEHERRKGKRT